MALCDELAVVHFDKLVFQKKTVIITDRKPMRTRPKKISSISDKGWISSNAHNLAC